MKQSLYFYLCIIFFILIIFSPNVSNAQNSSGEVRYSVILGFDENFSKAPELKNYYELAQKGARLISYSLLFNSEESLFKINDIVEGNGSEISFAKAFASDNTIYKTKSSTEIISQIDMPIGQFLVTSNMKTDWILTNESKIIDGYNCYKATATLTVVNSVKTFQFPVTAWYCPKIAVSFGPKGYSGLPGLILELQERSTTYGLKSIVFDKEPRTIIKPNKGKKVTEQEFSAILSQPFRD